MDSSYYLNAFTRIAKGLDKDLLKQKHMEVATGIYLESVFLKLYKRSWANEDQDPLTATSRIFFSVWMNEKSISQNKILYNIHALKLRQLNRYMLTSRQFAFDFRGRFKKVEHLWPNVEFDYGPQTLMQGWIEFNEESFHEQVVKLANQFLKIDYLIDDLLQKQKCS
jgi:hypothetical protein